MMTTFYLSDVPLYCERRVKQIVTPDQLMALGLSRAALAARLAVIVKRNVQSGRAQRAMAAASPMTIDQITRYIDRVIATFLREQCRLDRLTAANDDEWTLLFKQLTQRARTLLSRISTSPATAPEATEFAQAACETIFRTPFPFDVSFDAWATLILRNTIWQRYQRSRDLLDRNPRVESIERATAAEPGEEFAWHERIADPNAQMSDQPEVREWLLAALEQLPSVAQERVLLDLYFHGRSQPEVAHRLGRSLQAVYNLKHRGLSELRQILTQADCVAYSAQAAVRGGALFVNKSSG